MDTKSTKPSSTPQDKTISCGTTLKTGWEGINAWTKEDVWGDIYDPFQIGVSQFWRKNTSVEEATELANILRALRKLAGHIGPNVGEIEWTGMSSRYNDSIILDPSFVMGEYPAPSGKFDYLVGCVVHEAFHKKEWSDLVWEKIEGYCKGVPIREKLILQKMVYSGEDIYVDYLADESVLGLYTRKAREVAVGKRKRKPSKNRTIVDDLFHFWWMQAVGMENGFHMNPAYQNLLNELEAILPELRNVSQKKQHVTDRCELRYSLYVNVWEKVRDLIGSWEIRDKTLLWTPSVKKEEIKGKSKKKGKESDTPPVLDRSLINKIQTNLAAHSTDITPIIESLVGEDSEDVIPTSIWDFNIPSHPVIDPVLVGRMKAIFQNYAERKFLLSRGLTSGRIDRRRLYRAPINGRCFMDKQSVPNMTWNIGLLIDATGSMRGPKWKLVESTVANLHRAFMGFSNHLQAYAYFEADHVCIISRLIKGNHLLSVPPSGQTASGQAIIGAGYLMSKDKRRRLLIHITDGESNYGCSVQHGIDYCKAQSIDLITLGCGYKDRKPMLKQYGKSIQFLDHFGQLPTALESLLKWVMIYGGKGGSFSLESSD